MYINRYANKHKISLEFNSCLYHVKKYKCFIKMLLQKYVNTNLQNVALFVKRY